MKIGVISLGLIGGSILKSLSGKQDIELVGITGNPETLCGAKVYCTLCSNNISDVKNCEIVFVCSPISKTLEMLEKLEKVVSEKTIVTDVASVKRFVMNKKFKFNFIGSHPMAGLEVSGFKNSISTLFEGAKWVLTPPQTVEKACLQKLQTVIELTGAKTIITNAEAHDEAVAYISHLPMLIAQGLFKNTESNELAKLLASSGFRDTTRLAATNKTLACDMLKYNGDNILKAFKSFASTTENLFNSTNYQNEIEKIIAERIAMYSKDGKNIYES